MGVDSSYWSERHFSRTDYKMATNFEGVTTAELIADIKKLLAERRAQFERDYPVEVGA